MFSITAMRQGLAFNQNLRGLLFNLLGLFLGNIERENAVLEGCLDIGSIQVIADVEASLEGSGITLTADIMSLIILLVIVLFSLGGDDQIALFEIDIDIVLAEARQIHRQLICAPEILDISS